MIDALPVSCPYCGEEAEVAFDPDGGSRQQFVHDCPVCCQPWNVEVRCDRDGEWDVSARTADE